MPELRKPDRLFPVLVALCVLLPALVYLGKGVVENLLVAGTGLENIAGTVAGSDFVAFYAAGQVTNESGAAASYDESRHHAAIVAIAGSELNMTWLYPPTILLIVAPLAALPFLPAMWIWVTMQIGVMAAAIWRIAPHPATPALALLFPGVAHNTFAGQNGTLTAALIGFGMWALPTRPWLAGLFFGLISYKPHLALLIPICLLAGRHFRALAAMIVTGIGLALLGLAVFGFDAWLTFAVQISGGVDADSVRDLRWSRMPSVMMALHHATAAYGLAATIQGLVALFSVAAVAWIWWRSDDIALRAMALCAGTFLSTPWIYDYDLAMFVVPLAFLAWQARLRGLNPETSAVLALIWVGPLLVLILPHALDQQLGPLFAAAVLAYALVRAARPATVGPIPIAASEK